MYPGTQIQLIDNSVVTPIINTSAVDVNSRPLYAVFFTSPRGPERFTTLEGSTWAQTYLSNNTPDFYRDGQPLLQATMNASTGARLFSKRLVADNALLASATVFIAVNTTEKSTTTITVEKADDGALEVVENDTTTEDFDESTMIKLDDANAYVKEGIVIRVGDKVNKIEDTETVNFINIRPIIKSFANDPEFYKDNELDKENLYNLAKRDIVKKLTTVTKSKDAEGAVTETTAYIGDNAITNVDTGESYKFYAASDATNETGKIYPIFTIFDSGRGVSDKMITITPNYSISKSSGKMIYNINVIDANNVNNTIESWVISFDPDVKNSSLKSLDVQTVISGNSLNIDTVCHYDVFDELMSDLKSLGVPSDIFRSVDMLGKRTLGGKRLELDGCTSLIEGDETVRLINTDSEEYEDQLVIDGLTATPLKYGDNGDLDCMNKNPDVFYKALYEVLTGTFSKDIYNLDLYTFDCIFDANYDNAKVKKAIQDLCTYRGDCVCFMDMGTNVTNLQKIKNTMEWDGSAEFLKNFGPSDNSIKPDYYYNKDMSVWVTSLYYDIKNPFNNRQITVTATYSLSNRMVDHFINGRERAFAGQTMGITIPEAIEGTVNYIPKIYPKGEFTSKELNMTYPSNSDVIINEKEDMCDIKVNYATYYNGVLTMDTLFTTYEKDSALSYINNVMAGQLIIKEIRRCCPSVSRYNFIDGDSLSRYQEDIQDRVFDRYVSMFQKLTFKYVKDAQYEENKIFYGVIQIAYKDFTQSEIFKVNVISAGV